jgi:hypothetical protein
MSGLLFLTSEDFGCVKHPKGQLLCTNIRGFSLILFYSTACEHCQTLIPIFKRLPGSVNGCQFGMINVSTNKQCVAMSRTTIAPIEYVPYIVLYNNGRPYMRYNGPHDANEIKRFVIEVASNLQNSTNFAPDVVKKEGKPIPEYCIATPKCDQLVCYLPMDEAYTTVQK